LRGSPDVIIHRHFAWLADLLEPGLKKRILCRMQTRNRSTRA
jgi:hypothetical protein